ncbi:MAG: transporter substrate-binding domain-containing protein, partial [Pseudomonadota bacterium]
MRFSRNTLRFLPSVLKAGLFAGGLVAFTMPWSWVVAEGPFQSYQGTENQVIVSLPGNVPPQYIVNQDGTLSGFAIETATRIARTAKLTFVFRNEGGWEETLGALRGGDADVIVNVGITPDRQEYLDFTTPLETFGIALFRRADNGQLRDLNDIDGHKVGVVALNAAGKVL